MHIEERSIGFTASAPAKSQESKKSEDRLLLTTDKGLAIGLQDALCNTMATGTTGCGKTGSVGLPCASSLISHGLPGFLTATKTNFGQKIRSLAMAHGRSDDIVEFGSSPSAIRCNVLANMEFEKMRQFFEDMVRTHTRGVTENWVWLLKGIHQAAQCGQLLRFLSEKFPGYGPSISLVAEMINNQSMSVELYKFFIANVFEKGRPEHVLFRSQVDSQRFHILRQSSERPTSGSAITEEEQNTWNLQGIRMALQQFMGTPGMVEHFSDSSGAAVNMKDLLLSNKLVLAQFTTATGPAGDILARHMLSSWYEAILDLGTVEPGEVRCFTLLDEFQQIADLGESRFSDFRFSSLSREYGVINVILTQSESALHINCPNTYRVAGFTSNFNQRFFFYSNDSQTLNSATGFDPDIHLQDLEPTTMFVTHFDQDRRAHVFGVDSLNNAFSETNRLIEANPVNLSATDDDDIKLPALLELLELARKEQERMLEEKRASENAKREQKNSEKQSRKGPTIHVTFSHEAHADTETKKDEAMKDGNSSANGNTRKSRIWDGESADAPDMHQEDKFALRLQERFPDLVISTSNWCIPAGWQDYVEKALELYVQIGLKSAITNISLRTGILQAWNTQSEDRIARESLGLLNRMLEQANNLCMICGARLSGENSDKNGTNDPFDDDDSVSSQKMPICLSCMQKNGISKYLGQDPAHGERANRNDRENA